MDFSLSSSLVGSAVSNPDKLALDLQFAADKTLTARKGPTPVFTRASTGRFVGSDGLIQSAAINAPRFDHDPITLACKGLLIEESRTNSITGSNAFNSWTMSNSTVATSSVSTPEGTADAWKVVEDLLLATHTVTRAFPAVSGTTYTASVWLKSAENSFAFVGLTSAGGGFAAATFISVNLSTGAVTTAIGSPVGATSVAHSNGWFRVSFSLTAIGTFSALMDIRLSRDGLWANRSYLGNGVNGIYCYGAQVETGSFPTSYIPTTTASLARSADVCSITGSDFSGFYNPLAGSLTADIIHNVPVTGVIGQRIWEITDNAVTTNLVRSFRLSGVVDFRNTSGGSTNVVITSASVSPFVPTKYSYGFESNNYVFCLNNTQVGTDTLGAMPVSPNSLYIGNSSPMVGTFPLNGTITSMRYYKKRLSNAKLQALTV